LVVEQALEISGLSARYPGTPNIVSGLDLTVGEGEIVALVGANGAGKTTTLKAVAGLLKPSAGRIRFGGRDITAMKPHRRVREGVVLVPEGRAVLARMSVRDNLMLTGGDVEPMLELFPILSQRWLGAAGSLSGGEQQMLAIARGLLLRPKVLLLDEPSLGLSPILTKRIFSMVTEIRDRGISVLLVEQNARRALAVADRAYALESGRIVATGTGAELLADEAIVAAYLGGAMTPVPL
jgi:branched-chain amino acid transport system ATP-binding protein